MNSENEILKNIENVANVIDSSIEWIIADPLSDMKSQKLERM